MISYRVRRIASLVLAVLLLLATGSTQGLGASSDDARLLRPAHRAAGSVVINEFVASNQSGLQDEDGDYSDWIELYNPTGASVNLAGWSLTDAADNPGKWVFPAVTLPANGYLVVFASDKNRTPPAGQLHTNFRLSASGEYLGLYDNSTPRQVVDEFSPQFPTQYSDISYGLYTTPDTYRYFSYPTPGAINDFASAYLGVVEDVTFQVPRGYYDNSFTVTLQSSTPGASIRYSRTGFAPSPTTGRSM